jgi:phosphoribosyl 1,2-cyclic phosphodiesterase
MKPGGTAVDSGIRVVKMKKSPPVNPLQANPDYSLSVCILASGSKGNAVFVSGGAASILIDAGLSGVEIERRLKSRGLDPKNLDAILVSHEHSDHIQGVGVLSRRYKLPVYISTKTQNAASPQLGSPHELKTIECGSTFTINGLSIHPFSISHDAADPCGFTICRNRTKIGIATDFGIATAMVKEHLKKCSLLILEANHDEEMLINGPYPWPIKQRIKSRTGHLSNAASKTLLKELQHDALEHVMLAHLSETNNTPQKAAREVGQALTGCKARLHIASQNTCGALLHLK